MLMLIGCTDNETTSSPASTNTPTESTTTPQQENSKKSSTSKDTTNKESDTKKSGTNNESTNTEVTQDETTSHYEYTHVAVEGCVITESDKSTGLCVYKTKCPVCGETSSSQKSQYLKSNLSTGATCSNADCSNFGKRFDVEIDTNTEYIDD